MIESPWQNGRHKGYALDCLKDSLDRGEAPFASHLLYTQVLDDDDATQRKDGITTGHEFFRAAHFVAVYIDHGITDGMIQGMDAAQRAGRVLVFRRVGLPDVA